MRGRLNRFWTVKDLTFPPCTDSDIPAACVRVFQEKESIAKCITDLKALAKSTKAQATA